MTSEKDSRISVRTDDVVSDIGYIHSDQTVRRLKSRHLHWIGIGGTIGTALFLQIGYVLPHGGPGSLLLAFVFWSTVMMAINNCLAEMVSWIPISSPFIRFADRFVDPALGFCAGINFFLYPAILVPFEITAFELMIHFWTEKIPTAVVIVVVLVCYVALNVFAVRFYGESEFWLAIGKIILALGLLLFTFITMLGGNPLHDRFGFRNWDFPGTPFVEYQKTGSTGRFLGFLSCLLQAVFTMCGPEFVSMTAGEAENPRTTLPRTFKGVYTRVTTFFILGALSTPSPGAGSSPYVIAMQNMSIPVLPHIVNALIMLSIFSAGNSYVFCASRTLYGMALQRRLPRFLTRCTRNGVPIYCVGVTILIALLAFLQVSNDTSKVLEWFVSLTAATQVINYAIVTFTYLRFYYALEAQGISRSSLPFRSILQPFCGYYAFGFTLIMPFILGYSVFMPGNWDTTTFFFSYTIIGVLPILFIVWKALHRTRLIRPKEVTFFEEERKIIDDYEASFVNAESRMDAFKKWVIG
ncbi:general amino acid permease AGP2 [Desarmillaria tabescens]|uniref:General amino acid permease AGP2 n=1 Tax=Armillaria tabescens TaxID=1929756 RepID=A0AA39J6X1_ARMTA|nr:general amino acid permease AGP2 [Desarmillaria tabescens]KAK0437275.1 general amino acid permease AGP2 [Desarmillaria tabescens]